MATRTNLSTNLDYVAYASGDSMAAIFLKLHDCLLAHGWTQASGAAGTFFNTYDPAAGTPSTSDLRRVYSAPLANGNSGLSSKYVMLRLHTSAGSAINYIANCVNIELIPFVSWNNGTDVGTNPAGTELSVTTGTNGSSDSSNWNQTAATLQSAKAPHTWFVTGVSGFLYINATSKWICIWPYFISTSVYDGQRCGFLICGEISDDFASYTNVPPVYVTTLQRMMYAAGAINDVSSAVSGSYAPYAYGAYQPQFLMPVTPASTTGYTGVSNTTRTGYQAMGTTRIMLGHYGWFGYEGFDWYQNTSSYNWFANYQTYVMRDNMQSKPMPIVQNLCSYSNGPGMGKFSLKRYEDPPNGTTVGRTGTALTFAESFAPTALNSTNLKGIEPIFGGGCMTANYTGYNSNPYPMFWVLGRLFGLKWVGTPASGSWSTLDTVNMSTDSNYFYTKTGGTTNSFILLGAGPCSYDLASAAPVTGPTLFWALPA